MTLDQATTMLRAIMKGIVPVTVKGCVDKDHASVRLSAKIDPSMAHAEVFSSEADAAAAVRLLAALQLFNIVERDKIKRLNAPRAKAV